MAKDMNDGNDLNKKITDELNSSETEDAPSTETIENSTSSPNAVDKPRKSKLWLIILAVTVVLAGAVIALYYFFFMPESEQQSTVQQSKVLSFSSEQEIIDHVNTDLKGNKQVVTQTDGLGGQTKEGYIVYSPPAYKVPNADYKVLPVSSSGVGFVSDEDTARTNYSETEEFFKQNGFNAQNAVNDISGVISEDYQDVPFLFYSEFVSDDYLCAMFLADATSTPLKGHLYGVGCASMSSYDEASAALEPFYDAYVEADRDPADNAVFGLPTVQQGASNYEYAVVYQQDEGEYIGSLDGYYYHKVGEDRWTFFLITQGVPYCSVFDTKEAKQAFKGMKCFDEDAKTESKVP